MKPLPPIQRWGRFAGAFQSTVRYNNPLQEATLRVAFRSPSGREITVDGFWDGDSTWRVRFSPDEIGAWRYTTTCSDAQNTGLHGQDGAFGCSILRSAGTTPWTAHGPLRVSDDHYSLEHADGTPFLWLGDTAWNGPLLATEAEWSHYLHERVRQGFSAVQWVATHWIAAPEGDREGMVAFTGSDTIAINPAFFQRLDHYVDATQAAGLLNVPVLLWAAGWGRPATMAINPGLSLPDDQAILLARYMIARWQANAVIWILPGDGNYRDEHAERWRKIGRAVFDAASHAPTILHPGGMQWVSDEFRDESWLDIIGYQSGHGDGNETWRWLVDGPPAEDWRSEPARPHINLEPPYENHLAYQSGQPHSDFNVRRALYWSLLNAPTAGVTYGGHGVWGWDDGSSPPTAHPTTGTPLPWRKALVMPAAEQMAYVKRFFSALPWWKLRPAPELLLRQPGDEDTEQHISVARTTDGAAVVVYTPIDSTILLDAKELPETYAARWFNPRNGSFTDAQGEWTANGVQFSTPSRGDWALLIDHSQVASP